MNLRDAAQQALAYMDRVGQQDMYPEEWAVAEALRAALAQPEQEPVAFAYYWPPTNTLRRNPAYQLEWGPKTAWKAELSLYTHPPRREWQGLTEEERARIYEECAQICDRLAKVTHPNEEQVGPGSCAAAIRARNRS